MAGAHSFAMVAKWKITLALAAAVFAALVAFGFWPRNSPQYHLGELRAVQKRFNSYSPALVDRIRGIRDNQEKWDFHLNHLIKMGAVERKELVFTQVPYTAESSRRLWQLAMSEFPEVVDLRAEYLSTNAPGYGVKPYRMEVFDVPQRMRQWDRFLEANNQRE
jgi:hypothetical protein